MTILEVPASPKNYRRGRAGHKIERVIIHVSQSTMRSMDTYFATPRPTNPTSAHYGVSREGEIHRYVREEDTAWHAGARDINLTSIGIEHEGVGADYAPNDVQLAASACLCADICRRYGIPPSLETIEPHRRYRATLCPAGFPMERYVELVRGLMMAPDDLHTVVFNGTPADFHKLLTYEPDRVVIRGVFVSRRRGDKLDFREA